MNVSKKKKTARKSPKQDRSRATVETILDGFVRVLDQEDGSSASTSRIAEAAGVSVGSLYQYFENRDAILDALQDREFERARKMVEECLREVFSSERDLAFAIITRLLALYRAAPGLHRVLAIDGLRVTPTERVLAFDRRMVEMLRVFFEMTSFRVKRKNKHAAAFLLYHCVRATMLATILEEPAGISDDALVRELTDLIVSHLTSEG